MTTLPSLPSGTNSGTTSRLRMMKIAESRRSGRNSKLSCSPAKLTGRLSTTYSWRNRMCSIARLSTSPWPSACIVRLQTRWCIIRLKIRPKRAQTQWLTAARNGEGKRSKKLVTVIAGSSQLRQLQTTWQHRPRDEDRTTCLWTPCKVQGQCCTQQWKKTLRRESLATEGTLSQQMTQTLATRR